LCFNAPETLRVVGYLYPALQPPQPHPQLQKLVLQGQLQPQLCPFLLQLLILIFPDIVQQAGKILYILLFKKIFF
jgi:hypothetical protein